jgi:gliding motility-associated-like protein
MNTNYSKIKCFFHFNASTNKCDIENNSISRNSPISTSIVNKPIQLILKSVLFILAIIPIQLLGQSSTTIFDTPGATTWTVPSGVTSINVQLWGGGGGGAGAGPANGAGGGGGGAYTVSTMTVVPGTTYTLTVGVGGTGGAGCAVPGNGADGTNSWFGSAGTLFANAGKGGKISVVAGGAGGIGGTASSGSGIISYRGGAGAAGGTGIVYSAAGGGGGGSSAGTSANGVNGSGAVTIAANTLGGIGGIGPQGSGYGGQGGGYTNNPALLLIGMDGHTPGGGGGGAGNGSNPSCAGLTTTGGKGAHGRIIIIAQQQTIFTQTGSWTAPDCITSVIVEAWGGGGAGGGNNTTSNGGGGGGGGAYSKSAITVTPGQTYAVTVGTGGAGVNGGIGATGGNSWFINATTILAKGGAGGNPPAGGAGGIGGLGGAVGIGTTVWSGGSGGVGNTNSLGFGGGGGSSAGYLANGSAGGTGSAATAIVTAPGGLAPNGGGDGGDGQNTELSGNGQSGFNPGGGGGGSSDVDIVPIVSGGNGADGRVIILSYSNTSLTIGNNPAPAANVCANTKNVPIHGFTLADINSCNTNTDISFVTTGTYTASEILNYKIYYTTTNTFATSNLLATISTSTGVGTHSFPTISRPIGNAIYYWITMDVAPIVIDGHTIAVNGTTPADITATPTPTGSSTASGTQTLKAAPVLNSTHTPPAICSSTTFTYTATSSTSPITFAWSRATVAGITEVGTSNSGNISETLTNTTTNPINVTYVYVTTSGTTNCSSAGDSDSVIVTVNPKPQGSITGNTTCGADSSDIGQLTWVATSGMGPYTLIYNPGLVTKSSVISGTSFSATPNPAVTTTYTVTSVTDAKGCIRTNNFTRDTASIVVTSSPIIININPRDTIVCAGVNAAFTISATGVYAYGWEVNKNDGSGWNNVLTATSPQPTYSNTTTPTLDLSSTDTAHNGYAYRAVLTPACGAIVTTSNTATLTVNPIPVLNSPASATTICSGDTYTYTLTSSDASATFSWSRATVADITEPGTSGVSTVISETLTSTSNAMVDITYNIVTTAKGCSNSVGDNVVVSINPAPTLNSTLTPAAICSGDVFTYVPTSATPDSAFSWTRATITGILPVGPTSGIGGVSDTLINTSSFPINVIYVYKTTSGNCSVSGVGDSVVVSVNPDAKITLTSPVGTDSQSVCVNTAINTITYNIGGSGINATAGTSLPNGVNGVFNAGVFTISGTPNLAGVYHYTVNTSGTCHQDTVTGTITVGISLISAVGTNDQSVCLNTMIDTILYAVGGAGEGAVAVGLPTGVNGTFAAGVFTITGTPIVAGGFNYTVNTTGSCEVSTATGTITVGLSLISEVGTDSQKVCFNTPITNITYKIVDGDTPPPSVTVLPNGLSVVLSPGMLTITGTPLIAGLFNYTISANGSCSSPASLTGTILVGIGRVSLVGTDSQKVCKNDTITPIVYSIVGGGTPTITGLLPTGVSLNSTLTPGIFAISGTPTVAGTFNYTISAQGTCAAPAHLYGRIIVGIGLISAPGTDSQHVCKNAPITPIVYSVAGGDTIAPIVTGLPASFTTSITNGIFTISGSSSVLGLFNYTVTAKGSCTTPSQLYGQIIVGIGLSSASGTDTAQALCKNTIPIIPIVYSVVGGGTTTVTGLPAGLTYSSTTGDPAILTISGTPTVAGTFNYLVTNTGGTCPPSAVPGTITVNETTISPTSGSDTSQTICSNTAITDVTYTIGGTATSATVSTLPPGLTGNYNAGIFTISGTPNAQLQAGTYTYTITTTGTCTQSSSLFTLTILNPIANFTADTLIGTSPLVVNFINESQNSNTYNWSLGDSTSSVIKNPSNKYITIRTYTVVLTASEDSRCPDTASAIVIVKDSFAIVIPNIFTPNGDNINDIFSIISTDLQTLDVEIYNRWGLKLYEWHTSFGGWDGRNAKNGIECPDGTYYYILYAKGNNRKEIKQTGFVNLLR